MTENIQEIKNRIWTVKQNIGKVEEERAGWLEQFELVQNVLEAAPNDQATADLKAEIEQQLAEKDAELEPLHQQLADLQAKLPKEPEPAAPKFDPEKHPLLKKTLEKAEPDKPVVFNSGDTCEAQWTDKNWYKAKIKTVLGSASDPKYHVLFVDYGDTMTVDRHALRPLQSKRKRDPEPAPMPAAAPAPPAPATSTPHVISGPASVNPNAQAAKKDDLAEAAEPKKRKIPNKKQLEKGVNSWKDWNSKGIGKKIAKKDSMFRSGTSVNSRVGFTGSGAGMTETNKRVRYNHKAEADTEEEESGGPAIPSFPTYPPRPRY